jgi:succinoglycan biosynthesis transport protein ExoP
MPIELETKPEGSPPAPGPAAFLPQGGQHMGLMDVWRVLMKQRLVILAVTLLSLAVATWYAFKTPPMYESVARIQIKPQQLSIRQTSPAPGEESTAIATAVRILQSDSVMFETAQVLNLLGKPKFASSVQNSKEAASAVEIAPPERREMIGIVRGGLTVAVLGGTNIVEIHYRNGNPKLAAAVANQLADTYSDFDLHTQYERTLHISSWLQQQLASLKDEASDAQHALADYQRTHAIVGDENSNITVQTLQQLDTWLNNAEAERISKEARLRDFDTLSPDLTAVMGDDPKLAALRSQLLDLETHRRDLSDKYGPKAPKIIDLQAQIDNIQSQINAEVALSKRQVQDQYEAALGIEQGLRKRLSEQEDNVFKLNEGIAQYEILRNQAQLTRELYNMFQQRLKEATVTAGLSAANITVVDSAQVPFIPIGPRKRLNITIGLLAGLGLGIVVAFLIESIDDRVQTSDEVEKISGLPSLAAIPSFSSVAGRSKGKKGEGTGLDEDDWHLVALRHTKSTFAEAYRNLRSSLLLSSLDHPPRIIVFTSAFPQEGKTTTALNTAIVFAQRGEKVLLVDADLRRGCLAQRFGIADRGFGLSTVLASPKVHPEIATPLPDLPTLYVLPTGPRPPNPAEMLSSNRMTEQLRAWMNEFDRVVIDSAPLLPVSDTQALAVHVDSVVIVARAHMTRKHALMRVRDLLMRINAPVSGVVLNGVDVRLENFYTYRYGMYGYGQYGYHRYGYGSQNEHRAYGYEDDKDDAE